MRTRLSSNLRNRRPQAEKVGPKTGIISDPSRRLRGTTSLREPTGMNPSTAVIGDFSTGGRSTRGRFFEYAPFEGGAAEVIRRPRDLSLLL